MQDLMLADETAKLLGLEPRYFSEKFIFATPDFPKAYRFNGRGHRRYKLQEVMEWLETQREVA